MNKPLSMSLRSRVLAEVALPRAPGMPERCTDICIQNDTALLFATLDITTGAVIGNCYSGIAPPSS